MKNRMTHASLFSGIGAPEIAAAMLGWSNAFHCEINPFGRAVLEYWFPESTSYEDITKTDFRPWRGKIDILTGGFPCQPFSYAGQRKGREDERYLWPQMLRAIDEIRPSWVVGENVAGITTMVEEGVLSQVGSETTLFGEGDTLYEYELQQRFTIERVCSDLEHIGYSVQPVLVPAAAVGAPHRRDRIFIVAHNDRDADIIDGKRRAAEREVSEKCNPQPCGNRIRLCEEVLWLAENTFGDGCGLGEHGEQGGERNERNTRAGDNERICGEARIHSSDTDHCGSNKGNEPMEPRFADGIESIRDGGEYDAADTTINGCYGSADTRAEREVCNKAYGEGRDAECGISTSATCLRRPAPDTEEQSSNGCGPQQREDSIAQQEQSRGGSCESGRSAADGGYATNPSRARREECAAGGLGENAAEIGAGVADGTERTRSRWYFADTYHERLSAALQSRCDDTQEWNDAGRSAGMYSHNAWLEGTWWNNFPTVSPVHRGNDGLPFPMDDLTISFTKWRTESLKAYGNAIVPQVMYRIFQAIEQAESAAGQP